MTDNEHLRGEKPLNFPAISWELLFDATENTHTLERKTEADFLHNKQ